MISADLSGPHADPDLLSGLELLEAYDVKETEDRLFFKCELRTNKINYVDIIKSRFGNSFTYSLDIGEYVQKNGCIQKKENIWYYASVAPFFLSRVFERATGILTH